MHLDQLVRRFDSLAREGLVYRLASGAGPGVLQESEARLALNFPEPVAAFWSAFDGLEVADPPFKILPLCELKREGKLMVFCLCDRLVPIAFDVSAINPAGQWTILNAKTGYLITYTMASFWAVHMWSWIAKRRPIWYDVHKPGGALPLL
jgi:hypothetical protein